MMSNLQTSINSIKEQMRLGKMSTSEANVAMLIAKGILIDKSLAPSVKKSLNEAVKKGIIGKLKKKEHGLIPDIYYRLDLWATAIEEQTKISNKI